MSTEAKMELLQQKLDAAGVEYFRAYEFFAKGGSNDNPRSAGYRKNTDPPANLLSNIVPTAVVLNKVRRTLGTPIIISSCYRAPAYNTAIGGASASLHKQFKACDVVCHDIRKLYRLIRDLRAEGGFRGGLGGYTSFVHVDTRGHNATWGITY